MQGIDPMTSVYLAPRHWTRIFVGIACHLLEATTSSGCGGSGGSNSSSYTQCPLQDFY